MKQALGVSVPDRDGQLALLRKRLAGNEAFGRLRGTMRDAKTLTTVDRLIATTDSPVQFRKTWEQYSADVGAIGLILAQLERDGMMDAAKELRLALEHPGYLIAGEEQDIPLAERMPVTILVANFPATLDMIRWIRGGHWADLDNYLDRTMRDPENARYQLVQKLFLTFVSLRKYTVRRRDMGGYAGWNLINAYMDDVLGPLQESFPPLSDGFRPCKLLPKSYNDRLSIHEGARFAFICKEDHQADILARFTREQQKNISTWQCSVPRVMMSAENWHESLCIGFHPETDHAKWANRPGFSVSAGCEDGYGVALWHKKRLNGLTYGREHHSSYSRDELDGVTPTSPFCYVLVPNSY
ncbi:hypothetical protein KBB27_02910 [Patescibacteria group bacterium]|nr:hypothetical protein [Patescibacteria group bacterium]